ncbi:MAG TPA: carboxylesterase family protein [Bryobacteraceae bacterium]|nr:carboxylesterase family protein [Bryobacteraceae bacterium]
MKSLETFAFASIALVCVSSLLAETPKPVHTQSGLAQGTAEDGVTIYKGIPFAAAPLGDLRWRAPQPPADWSGVRNADKFAPACMQVPIVMPALGMDALTTNEDCLYLNVWTPAKSPNDRLAVMVWIYGGGFTAGGTSLATYNGANLAKKGVVVVSVAYRVGAFGFMAHPQLTAEQGGHSGNYGLLDQIAGLQWVKRNIAAFGGNPARVTIFGESAGGIAVSMLAASPLAKGLFQGAISESGGNFAPERQGMEGGENMDSLATGEKNGVTLFSKLGAASIANARKRTAEEVMKASPPGLAGSWPIFDGYVLPGDQYKLYEAGHYNDTPILIGTNSDEGALFVPTITDAAYQASTHSGYGEYAGKILAAYPPGSEALRSDRDLFRDTAFAWPTWTWARLQSKTGKGKVFVYYFSHRPPYPNAPQFKDWGAAHGGEIAYVFGNFSAAMPASAADRAVSEEMSSYWVNFAKTGDPNGKGLPQWPAFANSNAQVMNLNDPSKAIPVPNVEKLEVLDGYYAWRRSQAEKKH